jgi:hypothetical protein
MHFYLDYDLNFYIDPIGISNFLGEIFNNTLGKKNWIFYKNSLFSEFLNFNLNFKFF